MLGMGKKKTRPWKLVLLDGAAVGLALAAIMTFSDWRTNPGGVFHDASGTNWRAVIETALSWFVPTAGVVGILSALRQYFASRRKQK